VSYARFLDFGCSLSIFGVHWRPWQVIEVLNIRGLSGSQRLRQALTVTGDTVVLSTNIARSFLRDEARCSDPSLCGTRVVHRRDELWVGR
jgi:hypothetical protein